MRGPWDEIEGGTGPHGGWDGWIDREDGLWKPNYFDWNM